MNVYNRTSWHTRPAFIKHLHIRLLSTSSDCNVSILYFKLFSTGINKQISVDAAYFPVTSSDEPRAVSLPQDPHGNTMLSCLSSSFLCPLIDAASHSETTHPEPGIHHTILLPHCLYRWRLSLKFFATRLSFRGGFSDRQRAGGHACRLHLGSLSSGWR